MSTRIYDDEELLNNRSSAGGGQGGRLTSSGGPNDARPWVQPRPDDQITTAPGSSGRTGGWSFQGSGYQAPKREAPGAWSRGAGTTVPPPPPPPPPPPGVPSLPSFNRPAAPGSAPDYMGLAKVPDAQKGTGYTSRTDFRAPVAQLGAAQRGPSYQTAARAFQGEAMKGELENFAREWMGAPNRYGTEWMNARRTVLDNDTARGRTEGTRDIEEWAASRGLVGSDLEGDARVDLNAKLDETRAREQADLLERMAMVDAQDRSAAGGFGLQVGDFGRALGNDRLQEGRYSFEADRQGSRDLEDDRRARASLGLQAAGMEEDAGRFGWESGFRADQAFEDALLNRANLGLSAAQLADRAEMDRARFGLDTEQAAFGAGLSAADFLERGALNRYGLDLENRRAVETGNLARAELGLRGEQLDMSGFNMNADNRYRYDALNQQDARDAASFEENRNRMNQQESQYVRDGERRDREFDTMTDLDILRLLGLA